MCRWARRHERFRSSVVQELAMEALVEPSALLLHLGAAHLCLHRSSGHAFVIGFPIRWQRAPAALVRAPVVVADPENHAGACDRRGYGAGGYNQAPPLRCKPHFGDGYTTALRPSAVSVSHRRQARIVSLPIHGLAPAALRTD